MAGTSFDITLNDQRVREGLQHLLTQAISMEPAFSEIGNLLVHSIRQHFDLQQAPDGTPWAPLSPNTSTEKKSVNKILHGENLLLRDKIHFQTDDRSVEVGTDLDYAATHQFGDPDRNIPARPFLGIGPEDETDIIEILQEHLLGDF